MVGMMIPWTGLRDGVNAISIMPPESLTVSQQQT
jgi:hypothetical protein